MWTRKSFKVSRKNIFSCFWLGVFSHGSNGDKEKEWWRCGVVYGFDVFMSFLLFGMSELQWILLDVGWMWGKGVAKQWGASEILVVEQKKEE